MLQIIPGDLTNPQIIALLQLHVTNARAETAPGSAHALDLSELESPDISFWALWDGEIVLGVGALKRLSPDHGEVKSMYIAPSARRTGGGSAMLRHLIEAAHAQGMLRLSLETGSWPYFMPAQSLYKKHSFVLCAPFGDYTEDPNSVFMTLEL